MASGRIDHDLSVGLEMAARTSSRRPWAVSAPAPPIDPNAPDVFSPVVNMNIESDRGFSEGRTDTIALYAFDAFDLGSRDASMVGSASRITTPRLMRSPQTRRDRYRRRRTLVCGMVGPWIRLM